jgi:hypothetical protein
MRSYSKYKTWKTETDAKEYFNEIDKIFQSPMKISAEAHDILRSNYGIEKMISFVQEHVLPIHDVDVISYEAAEALDYLQNHKSGNELYNKTVGRLEALSSSLNKIVTENKNALSVFCAYVESKRIPTYLKNYYLLEAGKGKPSDMYAIYEYGAIPDLARLSVSGTRSDIDVTKDLGKLSNYTESDIEWIIAMGKVFSDTAFTEAVLKKDPSSQKKIKQLIEAVDLKKRFTKIITEGVEDVGHDFEILSNYHSILNRYSIGAYNACNFQILREDWSIPKMFDRLEKFEKASYKATGKVPTYMTKQMYMGKGEDEDADTVNKLLDDEDKKSDSEKKKSSDNDWLINDDSSSKYSMDKYDDLPDDTQKAKKKQTLDDVDPVAPLKLPGGTYNITNNYNYNNSYNKHTDNSKRSNSISKSVSGNTINTNTKSSGSKDFDEAFSVLMDLNPDMQAMMESNVESEDPNKSKSPTEIVKNAALDVDRVASKGLGHVQKGVSDISQAGKAIARTPTQVVKLVKNFIDNHYDNKTQRIKEDMLSGSKRYKILDFMRMITTASIPFALFNPLLATLVTMFVTIPVGGAKALRDEVKGGKYWKIKTELQNEMLTEIRITQDKIKDVDRDDPKEKQRLMRTLDALKTKYITIFSKDPKLSLKKDMDW